MIEISHLHKYFNKGRSNEIHVINDVTVSLPEKGIVAIFGRSGCGKTTLLNAIGGLDSYLSGSLSVMGDEVKDDPDTLRNRDMGYIFQNYNLLKNETCYDNVAYALRLAGMSDEEEIARRVETALGFVDMAKYARRTPDTLSGGQQQRVAIARAIVKNPRIILADEPTGNLDENNTVKIMDLLREIARDCLVLLVTHEAELVDYYCDTVIELSDGKVVDIRHNAITDGYAVRDKNTVYLGELEKETLASDAVSISYYGAKPEVPISVKIVTYGGKTYLAIDTPGVQTVDRDSELKFREGVFVRHEATAEKEDHVDMSLLPRVRGERLGRLFTVKSAAKSGYRANFGKQKKGKNVLRACLALFAAVIVMMTAIFGTSIGRIEEIHKSYNPNVFYVLAENAEDSALLNDEAAKALHGIDAVYVRQGYATYDEYLFLTTGFFETFDNSPYSSDFSTHGVFLPETLAKSHSLLAGRSEPLGKGELLLSSASADLLLERSTLSYLSDYDDLIGLSTSLGYSGERYTVVGIVDAEESAFYLDELVLAEYVLKSRSLHIVPASKLGLTLKDGEAIFATHGSEESYKIGDSATVLGKTFAVTALKTYTDYHSYLAINGIKKTDIDTHILAKMKELHPTLEEGSEAYHEAYNALLNTETPRWRVEYYEYLEDYCRDQYFFQPSFEYWLSVKKGIPDLYYQNKDYEMFKINAYQKEFGKLPTLEEIAEYEPSSDLAYQYEAYEFEYQNENQEWHSNSLIISDSEYIAASTRVGKSDNVIDPMSEESEKYPDSYYALRHTTVHASDPVKAAAYLKEHFRNSEDLEIPVLITPEDIFNEAYFSEKLTIIAGCAAMGVILAVMSVCMYFIMRSALMNRIREVGILRAIGVTKKNLAFRFAVETAVLVLLTVFIGYLLSSVFIGVCYSASGLMSEIFYYPVWLAGAVLFVLVFLSMLCGLMPILSLLKKTPSAILAKYDI